MAYVLHRLPAVADIILTPEYEHFAEAVMTSHSKADQQAALDISPAMGDILTDMQSCLQQLCGSSMCGDPEAVARLIAEKVAAMNYGSGCEHNSAGNRIEAGDLPESAVHQQPLQARATATEAMSAKSAQIQTPVLYNTSGSVSTVQLAWREWTCNGGSNTIEDRIREIKADKGLCIGRRNSALHRNNRHLPQLIEHLIGLGTSPEVAVDLMSKIADSWQLSLGQMREGARLYSSRTAKRDEDTVTPETTMTLGQFKQVIKQTFEHVLAGDSQDYTVV